MAAEQGSHLFSGSLKEAQFGNRLIEVEVFGAEDDPARHRQTVVDNTEGLHGNRDSGADQRALANIEIAQLVLQTHQQKARVGSFHEKPRPTGQVVANVLQGCQVEEIDTARG